MHGKVKIYRFCRWNPAVDWGGAMPLFQLAEPVLYPDIWPVPQNAQCILHKKHQGGKISHTEQRLSVMGHGYKWTTDNGCNGYNDTIKHKIMYERAYQLHLDEAVPLHAMFG